MTATTLEKRRANRKAAQPEVERLVRKYGPGTIAGCLGKIRERNKAKKKIASLRAELSKLQRSA